MRQMIKSTFFAPQMLYNCILDYMGATSGSCANVYDSAFSYCMNP